MSRARVGIVAATLVLAALLAPPAQADTVTIPPALDNTMFEDTTGSLSNGAGPALFGGNNGSLLARRALLRFDVAGNGPAGAVIGDVSVTMNVSNATSATPRTFSLLRVRRSWGEGTSSTTGVGVPVASRRCRSNGTAKSAPSSP